jgi:hypothetical protein
LRSAAKVAKKFAYGARGHASGHGIPDILIAEDITGANDHFAARIYA